MSQARFLAGIALLTVLAVTGLDPYLYGLYNHNITVPFLWRTVDAAAYPHDPLVDQLDYFYSWFIRGLAALLPLAGGSPERLFLAVHTAAAFLGLWAFHRMAAALTGREDGATVATFLFAVGYKSLAQVWTFEPILMERSVALPLQLWALERLFRGRWWAAFALAGLSFPVHPLSGAYVGFLVGFTALVRQFRRPAVWLGGSLLFLLGAAPSLWLKATHPSPELPLLVPDADWLAILRLHSAYHVFPFSWDAGGWIKAAAFLLATGLALKGAADTGAGRRGMTALAAVLVLGLVGTVFTEIVPLTLPLQFQFWRAFRFAHYLGLAWIGALVARAVTGERSTLYALPALALALLAWSGNARHLWAGAALLALGALFGWRRVPDRPAARWGLLLALALVPAALSWQRYGFRADNRSDPDWVAAQRWALDHSPADAAFIVPPAEWGWRVDSRRTSYGDWYDGTQNFFDAGYGRLWLERMRTLGFDGRIDALPETYRALSPGAFARAAAAYPDSVPVYVVQYADAPSPGGAPAYANDRFRIHALR